MKELVSKIQEVYATFSTDAALQIEKGRRYPCPQDFVGIGKTDERVS
jgi:hypothetical protein